MKNALILHGTDASHEQNWFPWLENKLIDLGYLVWVPDLPQAYHPNIDRYNLFLLNHRITDGIWGMSWEFNSDSIIIGHSSGAVEILGLLNDPAFPNDVKVKACFLVGAFKGDLGWETLKGMNKEFDFDLIKSRCSKFVFIHSENDPYCPIDDTRELCKQVEGKFINLPGQGHFTVLLNPKYTVFPKLLEIIKIEASENKSLNERIKNKLKEIHEVEKLTATFLATNKLNGTYANKITSVDAGKDMQRAYAKKNMLIAELQLLEMTRNPDKYPYDKDILKKTINKNKNILKRLH